ncbi:hypothetical protein F5B22DRAFT_85528 [Xylaria bambusicola]|uniref:uncharacterized protein n=1 Tax=Xylaria bambusicola TaxID=326684 RepID=UPI00200800A8|nr:uncharacterized protein F5B22DRAFT_85528 [Xylaria bambusicola]KAI0517958.1 hypothetical protein F5B22DRAFT_85528 [Xylaria bambusicola]
MADARALLRAHRAENRIKHPHAAYSDAGKLLCKVCHDAIKTESLWDTHIRSQPHKQRLQTLQRQQQQQPSPPSQPTEETQKRKRNEDDDEHMSDNDEEENETIRAKRSKTDPAVSQASAPNGAGTGVEGNNKEKTQTPPGLARRTSGTPVHGVEIAIPSRPATPLAGSNSTVSTPKAISMTRSPLAGSDRSSVSGASAAAASIPISTDTLTVPAQTAMQAPSTRSDAPTAQASSGAVNEEEWAAFEAEMSALDAPAPPTAVNGASAPSHLYADATISAPALSAAQVAAKSEEEEHERRKHALEAEIADEREDATRALEAEFEEMEELEGRVRRLKERREELRKESVMNLRGTAATQKAGAAEGKENSPNGDLDEKDEEEEDDDDEEEDDWDGFRFRV